jgi:hypothetical protein
MMIIEAASEWHSPEGILQQRRVAMSAGTREFWLINLDERCVSVTHDGEETTFFSGEPIPTPLVPCHLFRVAQLAAAEATSPQEGPVLPK